MSVAEGVLNLKWDDALRLVQKTDSYYARPEEASKAPASAAPSLFTRVRNYLVRSSKTRLCVQGCLAAYTLYVLVHPSRTVPCAVTVAVTVSESTAAAAAPAPADAPESLVAKLGAVLRRFMLSRPVVVKEASTTNCYLYQSGEGMQLLMKSPMPAAVAVAHAVSGMLLIPLTWIQKESVFAMRFKRDGPEAAQTAEEKKAALQHARSARTMHSICGISTVVCMALMTAGGLAMRSYSVFSGGPRELMAPCCCAHRRASNTAASTTNTTEAAAPAAGSPAANGDVSSGAACPFARGMNFGRAIIGFAVPWGIFIPAIMASAKLSKVIPHAVVGGLICKACVAVPLARVLGGVYQRIMGIHVPIPAQVGAGPIQINQAVTGQLERAYYAGIGSATIVIGVWAALDTYKLVRAAADEVKSKPPAQASATTRA